MRWSVRCVFIRCVVGLQTSAVLKSMGLEDKIATTDEVMQDVIAYVQTLR